MINIAIGVKISLNISSVSNTNGFNLNLKILPILNIQKFNAVFHLVFQIGFQPLVLFENSFLKI